MADSLIKNPIALRGCILYDVLRGKSIRSSYSNLCDVIGKKNINFSDFVFWFNRFSDGKFDLSYTECITPKPLEFYDLPENAWRIIIEKLDLKERLILRSVSKRFRSVFDDEKISVNNSLEIYCQNYFIYCEFNNSSFVYAPENWIKAHDDRCLNSKIIRRSDYVNIACNDLKFVLNNSNLQLEYFNFGYIDDSISESESDAMKTNYEAVKSIFASLNHKICAKTCSMETTDLDAFLDILPYLKPGTLEQIFIKRYHLHDTWESDLWEEKIDILTNFEQWKQAEKFYIKYAIELFKAEHFAHAKSVYVHEYLIDKQSLLAVRDMILVQSDSICRFDTAFLYDKEELEEYESPLGLEVAMLAPRLNIDDVIYHYPIPNSKDYVEFYYLSEDGMFIITKKQNRSGRSRNSLESKEVSDLSENGSELVAENLNVKERSKPKILEFSDLADDVVGQIVEKLNLKEQLTLRRVCKRLRNVVDGQIIPAYKSIVISCQDSRIICKFNDYDMVYAAEDWKISKTFSDSQCRNVRTSRGNDFVETVCNELKIAFSNPNLQLEYFRFQYVDTGSTEKEFESIRRSYEAVKSVFESLKHKINVKSCCLEATEIDVILEIVPFFKPGALEQINIERHRHHDSWEQDEWTEKIDKLTKLEQWKQAIELNTAYAFDYFKAEHFAHAKTVGVYDLGIFQPSLEKIRDMFLAKSVTSCQFDTKFGFEIEELESDARRCGLLFSNFEPIHDRYGYFYHYPLPDSTDYIEFKLIPGMEEVTVTKRSFIDISSNRRTPEFSDLSDDLLKHIVERSDLREQLTLRKVCKRLRFIVDEKSIPAYKSVVISCQNARIYCQFNDYKTVYAPEEWTKPNDDIQCENVKIIRGNGYRNIACNDLNYVLKNPNLQLESIEFEYGKKKSSLSIISSIADVNYKAVKSLLESFSHKISVKKCKISTTDVNVILDILPLLQSKTLKRIEICRAEGVGDAWNDGSSREKIDKIANLKQWKQAEELYTILAFSHFKPHHLAHFKHLDVYETTIDHDSIYAVRDMFSTKSFKVSQCHYYVKTGIDIEKLETEGGIIGKKAARRGRRGVFRHVSIPGSPDYLEFRFRSYWGDMIVTRKIGTEKLPKPKKLEFSDLTNDIVEKIVENLNLKDRLTLRKVSTHLRNVVDENIIDAYNMITIGCHDDYIYCEFNDYQVVYAAKWETPHNGCQCEHATVVDRAYRRIACNDLKYVLSNPNLHLDYFEFEYRRAANGSNGVRTNYKPVRALLRSLKHSITAESCLIQIAETEVALDVLPRLESGTLEQVQIIILNTPGDVPLRVSEEEIDKLTNLDQWKQAKALSISNIFYILKPHHLSHFERIMILEFCIHAEDVVKIRNMFRRKSSRLMSCHFESRTQLNTNGLKIDGKLIGIPAPKNGRRGFFRHYHLPKSTDYLEFNFRPSDGEMIVERNEKD